MLGRMRCNGVYKLNTMCFLVVCIALYEALWWLRYFCSVRFSFRPRTSTWHKNSPPDTYWHRELCFVLSRQINICELSDSDFQFTIAIFKQYLQQPVIDVPLMQMTVLSFWLQNWVEIETFCFYIKKCRTLSRPRICTRSLNSLTAW